MGAFIFLLAIALVFVVVFLAIHTFNQDQRISDVETKLKELEYYAFTSKEPIQYDREV